jgi:hypothetical protein
MMIQRANNHDGQHPAYAEVSVCDRWKDFSLFLLDMSKRPPKTSLGRVLDQGNYEPSNCFWQTKDEQILSQMNKKALQSFAAHAA